jgi:hypothetical protein
MRSDTCYTNIIVWTTVLLLAVSGQTEPRAQSSEGSPSLISNAVSPDLALLLANNAAKKVYGSFAAATPIPTYDLDGSVRAYLVVCKRGDGPFPDVTTILNELQQARDLLPIAKRDLAKAREAALEQIRSNPLQTEKPTSASTPEWDAAAKRLKTISDACWGIGQYQSYFVSASKDTAPYLETIDGLPSYYTFQTEAVRAATAETVILPKLERFYYGSAGDQMFEFSAAEKTTWVRLFPIRKVKSGPLQKTTQPVGTEEQNKSKEAALQIEREWVKAKWKEVLREVQP